jgi:uncharacterized phiE125 gp8 family phage protein
LISALSLFRQRKLLMSQPIYRLVETTPPAVEPLTLSETKIFLRIDHSNDDDLVTGLIVAARQLCESVTGRSLIARSYSLYLDRWPAVFSLPQPPLLSVTRINVYDANNTAAEFTAGNYFVDTVGVPGRIVLTENAVPPQPERMANGIEIQFSAGYGSAATSVPALLRQGMKQVIAHLYEHRGDSPDQALLASGAAVIFQSYRVLSLS